MPRKYQPLTDYLAGQPGSQVTLTFREIEQLVGALPLGAFARTWWSNNVRRSSPVLAWRSVGWRVEAVETLNRRVTFVRAEREAMPPRRFGKGHPSKYVPLRDYLAAQTENHITLTLARVEQIIDTSLPPSAYARDWWINSPRGRAHAQAWLAAGWRLQAADIRRRTVTFRREET